MTHDCQCMSHVCHNRVTCSRPPSSERDEPHVCDDCRGGHDSESEADR